MADFVWRGEAVRRKLEAELARRLDACAIDLTNHLKKKLSVEGAGADVGGGLIVQHRGNRKAKGKLVYGAFPSRPGQPPHLETGRGRASVAWEREGMARRVGTNVRYMRVLELVGPGGNGQTRPWLRPGFNERIPAYRILLSRPVNFGSA